MDLHHRLFATPTEADDDGRWAASGAMALTGGEVPSLPPRSLMPVLRSLEGELAARTAELGARVELDVAALLGERAAIAGLTRRGRTSCGGSTRLVAARDAWLAVALPRPDDVALVPAWLGTEDVARGIGARDADALLDAGVLLGLACARPGETTTACPAVRWEHHRAAAPRESLRDALIVDLSALWAGPLCGHLLTGAGARVVKVESASRPDGARRGPPAFYDLLHAGQESVVLDLPAERDRLRAVVRAADVVIDASRPRAMTQLGIDVHEVAAGGTVWVSITGHGRDSLGPGRVAFGDDAAVAGGLVAADDGGPVFVADAVADPLAGMVAAVAALDRFAAGGGCVIDISMARVAAWCSVTPPSAAPWPGPIARPRARRSAGTAVPAGRDTARVLRELGGVKSVRFRRAELDGEIVDVRCADGRITDVASAVPGADMTVDADGGALLPGLHDHHIHLFALAAARTSIDLASAPTAAGLDEAVRATAGSPGGSWLRVVGFHETVHGSLDRHRLDALAPTRRVRVQHRTGAMWVLNTAGLHELGSLDGDGVERGADGEPTGRLYGLDDLLRDRIDHEPVDLTAAGHELAAHGVTGVTDLTPIEDPAVVNALAEQALTPEFPLRVTITGSPALPASAGRGLPRGPAKLIVGDHRLPTIEELTVAYRRARAVGRNVAVHCASRVALVLALAAWEEAGAEPGDRIEHGAVIPLDLVPRLRELGLVVVTQPAFVAARGDEYLSDVDALDVDDLWRCGSLLDASVGVGGSTDAPFGPADPWQAIAAAVDRRTKSGRVLGAAERIDATRALAMFLAPPDDPAGAPRRVIAGAAADLCLLDRPLAAVLAAPGDARVVATLGRAGLHTFG